MNATHTLHVTGKGIGRERGLQPVPVTLTVPRGVAGHLTPAVDEAMRMVRRCLPLAGEPEYAGSHRAHGFMVRVRGSLGATVTVRFYVKPVA